MATNEFDVCLVGDDWTAALLGAILARRQLRVAVVRNSDACDRGTEATIPYITTMLEIMGDRFAVPEIQQLGRYESVRDRVTSNVRRNRHLTFLYHGFDDQRLEGLQFCFPGEHSEYLVRRRDLTSYLLACAAEQGAEVIERREPVEVSLRPDAATITSGGRRIAAECLVRTDGVGTPTEARPDPPPRESPRLHSFMTELSGAAGIEPKLAGRGFTNFAEGTLHHVFAGGMLQLMAAAHSPDARGETCLQLTLDERHFGAAAHDPERALRQIGARHPVIGRQLHSAVIQGGWEAGGWEPTAQSPGSGCFLADRFCGFDPRATRRTPLLFQPACGSVDLLLTLARVLLECAAASDFSRGRLQPFASLQNDLARRSDQLVAMTAAATHDFNLWNAVIRVWLLDSIISTLIPRLTYYRYRSSGDSRYLSRFDAIDADGWAMRHAGCRELFDRVAAACEDVDAGRSMAAIVAAAIFDWLRAARFSPPIFGFGDPNERCYRLGLTAQTKTLWWILFTAPPDMRRLFLDYIQSVVHNCAVRARSFVDWRKKACRPRC